MEDDAVDVRRELIDLAADMRRMKRYVAEMPSGDPHYSMFHTLHHICDRLASMMWEVAKDDAPPSP